MTNKIITVFGATGAQGGGLARAILTDPKRRFSVRAVTRRPDSEAARTLARAGARIVAADLDDPQSVARVMEGAYGAFLVTNFWEHGSPEKELTQATTLAEAAAHAGIEHAIWSTLEDTRTIVPLGTRMPVLLDRYNVPHFDAKGEANAEFTRRNVPATFLYTSGYWENLIYFGMGPRRRADGTLVIGFPTGDRRIPWIAAEDVGRSAFGIFARDTELIGRSVGIAGEHLTGDEMAVHLSAALGERVDYEALTPDQYRSLGFPGADDLGNMFQFKRDFESIYRALRDVEFTRALNPGLQSFAQWLATNARRIPVPALEAAA